MRCLLVALALAPLAAAGEPEADALRRRAAPLRPTAADLRFREIPWLIDPAAALAAARAEGRPLFVWLAGGRDRDGNPLERC
jgi:hypothetical protein